MLQKLGEGKRREINWQAMAQGAITAFNTDTTTRGFTGHEMIDSVGLVHMNGRVYDPTLGRFLSADPNVQALDNLQNFNRYSYVLNNPLSYTDPTGFFFSKLFKAIGRAFGKMFKAIGRALKKLLRSPFVRAIIQIVACANPVTGIQCAIASGAMAAAAGRPVSDVFKAMAFSFISRGVWETVGGALRAAGMATNYLVKGLVHGVVGGALSVARGGNFMQGFAANAIGAVAGLAANDLVMADGVITQNDLAAHVAISAAAGCLGSMLSGGKCANGAITAAFADMYNGLPVLIAAAIWAGRASIKVANMCRRSAQCRNYVKDMLGLKGRGGRRNKSRNSKDSSYGQHGYWIRDRWNNHDRVKVGISNNKYYDKIRKISFRAIVQVRRCNRMSGPNGGNGSDRYYHQVVRVWPAQVGARIRALSWERFQADRLRALGEINPVLHKRP